MSISSVREFRKDNVTVRKNTELMDKFYCGIGVKKDYSLAIKHAKIAAQSDAHAQGCLGHAYEHGNGVKKSTRLSLFWHRKSARSGEPYAQAWLGYAYEVGHWVKKSPAKSLFWHQKAAFQNHPVSLYMLGHIYSQKKDSLILATKYFRKAAELGFEKAQCNLGVAYENGSGVVKNKKLARYWYQKAAKKGDRLAQRNLTRLDRKYNGD